MMWLTRSTVGICLVGMFNNRWKMYFSIIHLAANTRIGSVLNPSRRKHQYLAAMVVSLQVVSNPLKGSCNWFALII